MGLAGQHRGTVRAGSLWRLQERTWSLPFPASRGTRVPWLLATSPQPLLPLPHLPLTFPPPSYKELVMTSGHLHSPESPPISRPLT